MSRVIRLSIVLMLNVLLIAALVIVGRSAHSVGVLAEGGDYLADSAAIGMSLLAIWLSHRDPTTRRPLGYPRVTRIAALVNGGWLLVLSLLVALGGAYRLLTRTPRVNGLPVLVVSGVAAVLMVVGALILGGDADSDGADDDGDLNVRAVLLDTTADAAAAAGVALSGGLIYATGRWYWLDPAVAVLIAMTVGYHAVMLLRKVLAALRTEETKTTTSVR